MDTCRSLRPGFTLLLLGWSLLASVSQAESSTEVIVGDKGSYEKHPDLKIDEGLGYITLQSQEGTWIRSHQEYTTPFKFTARAKTDSTNIRFYFGQKGRIIFNWEVAPPSLRFRSPLNGKVLSRKGQGLLEKDQFYEFAVSVRSDRIEIRVDGELRGEFLGDFAATKGHVSMGPSHGSLVTVESFIGIQEPPEPSSATHPDMTSSPPGTPVSGSPHSPEIALKKNQTKVNGLLVMSLNGGDFAGSTSAMTLSALRGDPKTPATLNFNQEVGPTMHKALEEVVKFIELRHDAWPRGRIMEISFENKYNPKDGPSAAVACALLLESAITGKDINPGFAVTGDMNADGSVQPIGGIEAKVRGATNQECTHIAVPVKNISAVYDTILMVGIQPIMNIQVFSITSFEEASVLAFSEDSAATKDSLFEFASIQDLYRQNPGAFSQTIKHPKVIEKLRGIVASTPNHLSASILLSYAQGQGPSTLSLPGSFTFIDENAYQIVDVIEDGEVAELEDLNEDQVADAISLLRRNKLKLDKRTWPWADSMIQWGTLMHEYQTNRPKAISNINRMIDDINTAGRVARDQREQLLEDPEIMEELLE